MPVAISYSTAPKENRSRAGVEFLCPWPARATCRRRCPSPCPGLVRCSRLTPVVTSCLACRVTEDLARGRVTFARPKSRILAWPRLVTKMLAGLMSRWTMPSLCAASSASAISMASAEQHLHFQRTAGDRVLQGHAIQKLHGDEGLAILFADVVNGADVGMVERGSGLGLALKALQRLAVLGDIVGQKLQGDEAVRAECLRPCKPHPCRRRRAFRQCGSARWSGRSFMAARQADVEQLRRPILGGRRGQVNARVGRG